MADWADQKAAAIVLVTGSTPNTSGAAASRAQHVTPGLLDVQRPYQTDYLAQVRALEAQQNGLPRAIAAALRDARRQGLEEAARVCDDKAEALLHHPSLAEVETGARIWEAAAKSIRAKAG